MKKGDIVRFAKILQSGEENLRFVLLEDPDDRGKVEVQSLTKIPSIHVYKLEDFVLAEDADEIRCLANTMGAKSN